MGQSTNLLRRPKSGARDGHQLDRQRGPYLPCASSVALKETLGVAATTCSYGDWIGTDLLVFIGSNPANNQPVTTKYLHYAKKAGTKVVLSIHIANQGWNAIGCRRSRKARSSGRRSLIDLSHHPGRRYRLSERGAQTHLRAGFVDHAFIAEHTTGFDALKTSIEALTWKSSKPPAASPKGDARVRTDGRDAKTAVFVWSMGITQHATGVENVRAIVDLRSRGGSWDGTCAG